MGTRPHVAAQPTPDFGAAREEAVRFLSDYVRIDTVNPPGNESRGTEYLKAILAKEGIPSETFELVPGRGNLVARLKGNGSKKPVLILGHVDTVPIEREKWTVDPLGGLIRDGFIYGRGASDDKSIGIACLEVMLLLHRLNIPLDRDVIYLAEAGEESSTQIGIDFMVAQHWDKIAAEFSLTEGGGMTEENGTVKQVVVTATEKLSRNMKLVAHGVSAHGSIPRADNPLVHLSAALVKLAAWRPPMRLNEVTRAYFSPSSPPSARPMKRTSTPTSKIRPRWKRSGLRVRTSMLCCGPPSVPPSSRAAFATTLSPPPPRRCSWCGRYPARTSRR